MQPPDYLALETWLMHESARRFLIALSLICLSASASWSADNTSGNSIITERRKIQFPTDFAYALFPYPYSLPGIGQGLGLVGGAMNIADTYTDVYGIIFTGDVRGTALGVADIHILPRKLIFDLGYGTVNEATIQSFSQRGMNSDKHDYQLIEFGDTEYYGGRMTATFFDRRFEVYGAWYQGSMKLKSIRDKDGNVIVPTENAPRERGNNVLIGTRLDLTDDYADPRRGIRLDISRSYSPPRNSGPDYYVVDYNTTGYIPIGRRSTWAFNVLRSDAVVVHQGETDPAALQNQLGLHCDPTLPPDQLTSCQQAIDEVINNTIANNKYGTATQLGGFSRLRSYSQGRYKGAHTLFYGTEVRWNLTDERTPYNIFIMKDIRTAVQVSAFYEIGSTADASAELGKIWRDSYGLGLRIIGASGVVLRGDLAFGREGFAPEIFIGYPWEI